MQKLSGEFTDASRHTCIRQWRKRPETYLRAAMGRDILSMRVGCGRLERLAGSVVAQEAHRVFARLIYEARSDFNPDAVISR